MEVKRYEVVIKGAVGDRETVGDKEQRASAEGKKQAKSNEDVIAKGFKTTVGAMATIYGMSQLVVQPIMREKVNMAVLTGDIVQAKNFQRQQANVNKVINAGFNVATIAGAFMMSRTLGFIALGSSVVREVSGGINRYQANKMIEAESQIDSFINSYDRAKMSKLIRG